MSFKSQNPSQAPVIIWFRRDLRLSDHPALYKAAGTGAPVIPVFILDEEGAGRWKLGGASRWWLANSLRALQGDLEAKGSRLILRKGQVAEALAKLVEETGASAIYFTRGYEPYIVELESRLKRNLEKAGVECRRFGGHLLVEPEALRTSAGGPFKVFTPFYRACLAHDHPGAPTAGPRSLCAPRQWPASDELRDWELEPRKPDWARGIAERWMPGEAGARTRLADFLDIAIERYPVERDRPDLPATSQISPHLAFGEISPRQIWYAAAAAAQADERKERGATAFLRELYWREFSYHLLFHWPGLPQQPFRKDFAAMPWRQDADALVAWQKGLTGYPIVDAGMRQLWITGWMHNRVRMIAASFLTKHLLIPWQTGEAWFWDTLIDADLANNAASWQWVAGSGADAAPYFRIFNPVLQGQKFDSQGDYVRRYVPELGRLPAKHIHAPWDAPPDVLRKAGVSLGHDYPHPIVDHKEGRRRALTAYEAIKTQS